MIIPTRTAGASARSNMKLGVYAFVCVLLYNDVHTYTIFVCEKGVPYNLRVRVFVAVARRRARSCAHANVYFTVCGRQFATHVIVCCAARDTRARVRTELCVLVGIPCKLAAVVPVNITNVRNSPIRKTDSTHLPTTRTDTGNI